MDHLFVIDKHDIRLCMRLTSSRDAPWHLVQNLFPSKVTFFRCFYLIDRSIKSNEIAKCSHAVIFQPFTQIRSNEWEAGNEYDRADR